MIQTIDAKAKEIKLLITDVDGVLTDGILYFDAAGVSMKAFSVHDGLGLKLLMKAGIEVAVITACKALATKARMEQLGIKHLYMGEENKVHAYEHVLNTLNLTDKDVAYIGDDLPDLPLVKRAQLGITVADANHLLHKHAQWITTNKGGERAVREVCDRILHARGCWDQIEADYLS
jgi:3-deoxy-D-manno-octulosonate 8-phosphate phosphatase (KDO 8-P phosphatase)